MKKPLIGIFPNLEKKLVLEELPKIVEFCLDNKINIALPRIIAGEFGLPSYDTNIKDSMNKIGQVLTLGGDGTILRAVRYMAPLDIPMLGINLGKLGFLTEVGKEQMFEALLKIRDGNYSVEKRSMLQATMYEGKKIIVQCQAINEFVLAGCNVSRLTRMSMKIGGQQSPNSPSDGIIVATATGSTAYSLSAGGPIVYPDLDVTIITPVCAHALTSRPMVIPMTEKIELISSPPYEQITLSGDGIIYGYIQKNNKVIIEKSPWVAKFMRIKPLSYYEVWQSRLIRNEDTIYDS